MSDNNNDILVSVHGISKCYLIYDRAQDRLKQIFWRGRRQYFKEFWALKGIDFEVNKGETFGIIGRNGSGKSTLLQIIAGILSPTSGLVKITGRVSALLELGSGFNPDFTGRENVFLNGAILGISRKEMERRINDIISFADIGEFIDQPVKVYSSGMYVRLAFSVQALIEPDILIVDEALAVGDEKFQRKCYSFIDTLRERGTCVLIVTHSTSIIEKYCQRALLLDRGEVHGLGQTKDIIDQYHALLYADEKAYLKILNKGNNEREASETKLTKEFVNVEAMDHVCATNATNGGKLSAFIQKVWLCDSNGDEGELFYTGTTIVINFKVVVLQEIKHLLAGIRLRTVEGVEVYGTSTEYVGKSPKDVKSNTVIVFQFKTPLILCEGTYFISVAVAQKVDSADMLYLDKKSDAIILKVKEGNITATGIAHLGSEIDYWYEVV